MVFLLPRPFPEIFTLILDFTYKIKYLRILTLVSVSQTLLNQNIFYAPTSFITYFKKYILIEMLNFNKKPMLYKQNQLNILSLRKMNYSFKGFGQEGTI